jgi:hypothetical protein
LDLEKATTAIDIEHMVTAMESQLIKVLSLAKNSLGSV